MKFSYSYCSDGISFICDESDSLRKIYLPLCGPTSANLKSSITPYLSGDIKIDKERFLTKPTSREDLRQDVRNFFVYTAGKGVFSLTKETKGNLAQVQIGPLWHSLTRRHTNVGLEMNALNFIPVLVSASETGWNAELMRVTLKNISSEELKIIPTFSLPIFGRALANKHDHEHVTSLLHRIEQLPEGVLVKPTMSFDERGHQLNQMVYFVFGVEDSGALPWGSFPTLENFCGERGTLHEPEAVLKNFKPTFLPKEELDGKEAMGALRFKEISLKSGEEKEYLVVCGIAQNKEEAQAVFKKFSSSKNFENAWEENKKFWLKKCESLEFRKEDARFNAWSKWVTLQPIFRRIYGCSFLPDHDYGKGGKGWRDIWQDLLSLILIEPENIRENLINNFAGVRVDGSNATIIGSKPGEFIADRNNITRVWMDHGLWPFTTMLLYIHQAGDFDILFKEVPYFRDPQFSRTFEKDLEWTPQYGNKLKTKSGEIYQGTILEHILVQHLVQFFNVGEHNIIRLESADWNDGLDMASDRGESVAFTSFYAGNLLALAELLKIWAGRKKLKKVRLAKELKILLDTLDAKKCNYNNPKEKRKFLFERYFKAVQPEISGEQIDINVEDLTNDLREKGQWIFKHIRCQEKIKIKEGGREYGWFNGYYDNQGKKVEGKKKDVVWMTLTGQVFAMMSGLASGEEIEGVVRSVNRFLKNKDLGGIHLNTDFGDGHAELSMPVIPSVARELEDPSALRLQDEPSMKTDLRVHFGRAFGFAYGTKENGAFFSHMNVMYAYALYTRGFVREGYEVLNNLYKMSVSPRSKIYPGIPEYFDLEGRGMYPYLTGSASWFILTQLTQVFGLRGEYGDLILEPKLVKEEFNQEGIAQVTAQFAGKKIVLKYINKEHLDFGHYKIKEVFLNNQRLDINTFSACLVKIPREIIHNHPALLCDLTVQLL